LATRIILSRNLDVDATYEIVPTIDGEQNLKPPAGIKWTIVELRVGFSGDTGEWKGNFDTEKYWNGRSELDFLAKGRPHTVALDVVQPHFVEIQAKADTANAVVTVETVIEESAVGS
jgi:hypothetical protein